MVENERIGGNDFLPFLQSHRYPIQWKVIDFSGFVVWQGGDFAGELGLVFLAEVGETFGLEIFAGFDFDGDNDAIFLNHKINFARAPFVGPIADEITFCSRKFLHYKLFCNGSLVFREYLVAIRHNAEIKSRSRAKQSCIYHIKFERRGILICF